MRIRAFIARDMAEALAMVRREMGPDAIILSSEKTDGGNLEVRAAAETPRPDPAPVSEALDAASGPEPDGVFTAEAADEPAAASPDLAAALRFHGVSAALADALTRTADAMGEAEILAAFALALETRFSFRPVQAGGGRAGARRPVLLAGPPGAGKSSACGKLAARAAISGHSARLICADADRAGAHEQLAAYAEAARAEYVPALDPARLAEAVLGAGDALVLIDAPAANPRDAGDLSRLQALCKAASAEPVLVLDAGTAPEEAAACARAFARIGAQRLIATRFDAVRRKGAALAAADAADLAFAHISASPYLAGGFAPATPLRLARMLLEDARIAAAPARSRAAMAGAPGA